MLQVVQNFAANVALSVGASPIMANYGEEAADLAKLGGALVINMVRLSLLLSRVFNCGSGTCCDTATSHPMLVMPKADGTMCQGTVTPEGIKNYKQALKAYNDAGRPVIFDPVG